ncbi:MAG: transcriptional regulator [Acidimicrobiia bacterium]|nr:transcriptional regulator [Acidimicrobiia bacterium]
MRELLLGGRSFRELEEALAGISPSLLTKRLNELAEDGLVMRNDAPPRSKRVDYRLTDAGRSLEPVIVALILWGTTWMLAGPGEDRVDARWAPLALQALLDGDASPRGCVHLDVDGRAVTVRTSGGRRRVAAGHHGRPDATVSAPLPILLAIATKAVSLGAAGVAVSGDTAIANALLTTKAAAKR